MTERVTETILSGPASNREIRELARMAVDFARRAGIPQAEDDGLLALLLVSYQMGKRARGRAERYMA